MTEVMTVCGPIAPDAIGQTLMHEHLFINLLREYRGDGLLNDPTLAVLECGRFKELGGSTIVDCTNRGIGREPELLRRVSTEAGINIVMGSGHYRVPYIEDGWLDSHATDEVADQIVRDLTVGVDGTGVRAGIIGEVGADKRYISALEERSFRAAARAHLRTGVTVTTHAARWPVGIAQLDLLTAEGVPPERVIIGHCDTVPIPEYHLELARRGAFVQFDNVRGLTRYDLERQVEYIVRLYRAGYLGRVLLSHDVCLRSHLSVAGGPGFTLIMTDFVPMLHTAGLTSDEVRTILVDNPRRALTGSP